MKLAAAGLSVIVASSMAALPARAQSVSEAFARVKDSVVVVRTAEKRLPVFPDGEPLTTAGKPFGGFSTAEVFQTAAAVNVGNSGGPMFNMKGEVIGIVSSMITRWGGYEGLGFVIASNTARTILLEEGARWSGMEGVYLAGDSARLFNLPQRLGILVQRVAGGSPADRMGILGGTVEAQIEGEEIILGGDVILEVGGIKLSEEGGPEKIRAHIQTMAPGQELKVTVLRGGRRVELRAAPFAD